jgi:hypothetical protein
MACAGVAYLQSDLFVAEATAGHSMAPWSKSLHATTIRLYTGDHTDALQRTP